MTKNLGETTYPSNDKFGLRMSVIRNDVKTPTVLSHVDLGQFALTSSRDIPLSDGSC